MINDFSELFSMDMKSWIMPLGYFRKSIMRHETLMLRLYAVKNHVDVLMMNAKTVSIFKNVCIDEKILLSFILSMAVPVGTV